MENQVDGSGMVFHIQPVAHILAFAIHRQWLAVADVVDEQRYKFFRELIRTIVVRAVGHDSGKAVSIMESSHKMVTRSLGGTIGAVRLVFQVLCEELAAVSQMMLARGSLCGERRFNAFGVGHLQSTIYFIGADMVKAARNAGC